MLADLYSIPFKHLRSKLKLKRNYSDKYPDKTFGRFLIQVQLKLELFRLKVVGNEKKGMLRFLQLLGTSLKSGTVAIDVHFHFERAVCH
jgi:hypothetical protein